MTRRQMLRWGEDALKERQFEEAAADAWLLFEYVTGIDRTHYFLRQDEDCLQEEQEQYRGLIRRRLQHVPVQYLTGTQVFMGLPFRVNDSVLIPRQDTELLVLETERRLTMLKEERWGRLGGSGDGTHAERLRVLDLCTGSGCIIVSLAKRNQIAAVGTDLSGKALDVARQNARALETDAVFLEGDLFAPVEGTFDCIVSNPPYIERGEISGLMPEVRLFEPLTALDGHEDGLYFYRRIVKEAASYLKPGGWLLFETGCGQGAAVSELLRAEGYSGIEVKKDLAGLDRVVAGRRQ